MTTISVAMATYNGESYLREQLESLIKQSHLPHELIIGDDGSTDGTIGILEEFRKMAPFPVYIKYNENNLGYAKNFLETAKRCKGDWISFCDQDDVWLPNKLAETVNAIHSTDNCNMVLQNAWLCDQDLRRRNRKFPDKIKPGKYKSGRQYGFWVWPGFLKTIRSDIVGLLQDIEMPRSWFVGDGDLTHDKWTCLIANAIGGVVVVDEPIALYRRHSAALTGNYHRITISERIARSRSVSSTHYVFLADVAEGCADYMHKLSVSTDHTEWASAFSESSKGFRRIEKIQRLRSKLYAKHSYSDRCSYFLKILMSGGYFGAPFHSMGARSAAKDAMIILRRRL